MSDFNLSNLGHRISHAVKSSDFKTVYKELRKLELDAFRKGMSEAAEITIKRFDDSGGKIDLARRILALQHQNTSLLAKQKLDTECIERIRSQGEKDAAQVELLTAQIDVAEQSIESLKQIVTEQTAQIVVKDEAVKRILNHYVKLVNSGDAGNWNPEDESVVKSTRVTLTNSQVAAKELLDRQDMFEEQIRVADVAFNGLNNRHNELFEQNKRMKSSIAFFSSVIKSGEKWSDVCETVYQQALSTPNQPVKE